MVEANRDGATSIMGILSDAVSQVMEVPLASVQAPPKFGTEDKGAFLKGVASIGEKFLLILDLPRVLAALDSEALGTAEPTDVTPAEGVDPHLGRSLEQSASG
jgi:purine-binding chemotaxis protein CheW